MPRKVQKRKAPVKEKQSQRQSQNVVVNIVMAKHRAPRKPSGKKAQPIIYQPPIRMIQSYGDVLAREPPKPSLLGEEIKQILEQYKKHQPVSELREDFLSRVESKPKDRLIPKYDFESGFEEPVEYNDSEGRLVDMSTSPTRARRKPKDPSTINYDGATIEMLMEGNYGRTKGGGIRNTPTKKQEMAIERHRNKY